MYALNLDSDNRILSVTFDEYASEKQPRIEILPEGDVSDYKYVDGEFVYEPLPKPEPLEPMPTLEERTAQNEADIAFIAMMADINLEV